MTRGGFFKALLGVPFAAGWVKKLDKFGEPTLEALEPVASDAVSIASVWDQTTTSGTATTAILTATDSHGAWYYVGGQQVRATYTM